MTPEQLEKLEGVEVLRRAVRVLDSCRESFNMRYSAEDLLKIVRACWLSDWDVYPDDWTPQQIKAALENGTSPKFEETSAGLHALEVSDCHCRKCRRERAAQEAEALGC